MEKSNEGLRVLLLPVGTTPSLRAFMYSKKLSFTETAFTVFFVVPSPRVIAFEEPASARHSDPTIPNLLKELCRHMVLPFLGSSIIGRRC